MAVEEIIKLMKTLFEKPLLEMGYNLDGMLSGSRIIDVGCGLGELVSALQEINPEAYGIDTAGGKIRKAKLGARYPEKIFFEDVCSSHFEDGFFDTAISMALFASTGEDLEVAQHAASRKIGILDLQFEMVKGVYRILRKGGLYLVYDNSSIARLPLYQFDILHTAGNENKLILEK